MEHGEWYSFPLKNGDFKPGQILHKGYKRNERIELYRGESIVFEFSLQFAHYILSQRSSIKERNTQYSHYANWFLAFNLLRHPSPAEKRIH